VLPRTAALVVALRVVVHPSVTSSRMLVVGVVLQREEALLRLAQEPVRVKFAGPWA
jgi:hypothetical protein